MAFLPFSHISREHKSLGAKAYNLAMMSQHSFPVPQGAVLTSLPRNQDQWSAVFLWWKSFQERPLAVRSSASDEDSGKQSFAGQNSTFLNVSGQNELRQAIEDCFKSLDNQAAHAYRKISAQSTAQAKMNVVLQEMVNPWLSGVYFSQDPRGQNEGDLLEVVEGLGEALVSGKITPFRYFDGTGPEKFPQKIIQKVRETGKKVSALFHFPVDMEWSVDHQGKLFVLQARPITALVSTSQRKDIIQSELDRLNRLNSKDALWDQRTFCEWTGLPCQTTLSLYQKAFSAGGGFHMALQKLGYIGMDSSLIAPGESLLQTVMGTPYIDLNKLTPLYFGPIPFEIEALPRPHLHFNLKKVKGPALWRTPLSIFRMFSVAWGMSTKRKEWLAICRQELSDFTRKRNNTNNPGLYRSWSDQGLKDQLNSEALNYQGIGMMWPLTLAILVEATHQSLLAIMSNIFGKNEAKLTLNRWLAKGLHTATIEMHQEWIQASKNPQEQEIFLAKYGHRGMGELDLQNARWIENPAKTFEHLMDFSVIECSEEVEQEINALKSFKRSVVLEEWYLLKEMLELRESWKMELLRPYAQIRYLLLEIAERSGLNDQIFSLSIDEILSVPFENLNREFSKLIHERLNQKKVFKLYHLPSVLTLNDLERILSGKWQSSDKHVGEPLSPGVISGEAYIVSDASAIQIDLIPEGKIIIAETSDPSWTALFAKSKGLVLEKGGVLGHSAILARELGLPAIGSVPGCTQNFKTGEQIFLDANNGVVGHAPL